MVSIGIVGIGNWGGRISQEYHSLLKEGLIDELYICDTRSEILNNFATSYRNVRTVANYQELDVDGVHIAIPNYLHYDVASYFLEKKVNVLVEKPMTRSYEESLRLMKEANKYGCILKVGHIFRFNSGVRKLGELIKEGQLGEVYNILLQWKTRQIPLPKEEDIVFDLMPHPIDIMLYLLNDSLPRYIFGSAKSFVRKGEKKEEWAIATFEYEDGLTVNTEVSWLYPIDKVRRIEVNGSNGHAILDAINQSLRVYVSKNEYDEIPVEKNNTIRDEALDFVQAMKTMENIGNCGRVGTEVVRLLELIRDSIDSHAVRQIHDLTIDHEKGSRRVTDIVGRRKITDCLVGEGTRIYDFTDLYKCKIGKNCKIDSYVYIEGGVEIGDTCKIRAHTFLPEGVRVGNNVFIGPGAILTNDMYPKSHGEWKILETVIDDDVSICAGAVLLPGIKIGKGSIIGSGSVVTKDVPPYSVVVGNPGRVVRRLKKK